MAKPVHLTHFIHTRKRREAEGREEGQEEEGRRKKDIKREQTSIILTCCIPSMSSCASGKYSTQTTTDTSHSLLFTNSPSI